jgi:predicted N-acetyltransferase YhbS
MTHLVSLSDIDERRIDALLDDAFGTDRHGRTAYMLRTDATVIDHLSFACIDDDQLVGSIQCWPVKIEHAPLILVGPVAVATSRQNQGIGRSLMEQMLSALLERDAPMAMIGDPEYYGRFGFSSDGTTGWALPGPWEPHRLLLRNTEHVTLPVHGMLAPAD